MKILIILLICFVMFSFLLKNINPCPITDNQIQANSRELPYVKLCYGVDFGGVDGDVLEEVEI